MRSTLFLCAVLALLLPPGCSQDASTTPIAGTSPRIRVLLLQGVDRADLMAPEPRDIPGFPGCFPQLSPRFDGSNLAGERWMACWPATASPGVLTFSPSAAGPIRVNGVDYRGVIRLLPAGGGRFNVINDVAVDDYLAGVVTKEMYPTWPIEAIKAQAVASRTYAPVRGGHRREAAGVGRVMTMIAASSTAESPAKPARAGKPSPQRRGSFSPTVRGTGPSFTHISAVAAAA